MSSTQLPLDYLVTSSENCLEGFELARLSQISILRRQFSEVFDELVEAEIAARVARWMLDGRRTQTEGVPIGQIASAPSSLPEPASDVSEIRQLPSTRDSPKPRRGSDAGKSAPRRLCSERDITAASNDEFRPPAERQPESSVRGSSVSAGASASLELLEKSAACDAQSIGHGMGGAARVCRKSTNCTAMLPFPIASAESEASASIAVQTTVSTARRHAHPHRTPNCVRARKVHRKVLSLAQAGRDTWTGIGQISEDIPESAQRKSSSIGNGRRVVRPFPPVRERTRGPRVFGNVALSQFY
jgi:hypothetical protein